MQENETPEEETLEETTDEEQVDDEQAEDDEPDYDTLKAERDALKKELAANSAKALHWKNKADKIAAKKAEAKKSPGQTNDSNSSESDLELKLERLELKQEGFNDEEVNYLMKNGGKVATDDKFVMAAIEKLREQSKAEAAVAKSSSTGSGVLKNVTPDQLEKMSSKELEEKILSGK